MYHWWENNTITRISPEINYMLPDEVFNSFPNELDFEGSFKEFLLQYSKIPLLVLKQGLSHIGESNFENLLNLSIREGGMPTNFKRDQYPPLPSGYFYFTAVCPFKRNGLRAA